MKYLIVIYLEFHEKWKKLSRSKRNEFFKQAMGNKLAFYESKMSMKSVDCEPYSNAATDMIIIETDNLKYYHSFILDVSESELVKGEYIQIKNKHIGLLQSDYIYNDVKQEQALDQ